MSCANSVLPVFMTKPPPQDCRGGPPAIQIRPSNEVPEILMRQKLPSKLGSANRTVVVGYMYVWLDRLRRRKERVRVVARLRSALRDPAKRADVKISRSEYNQI